MSAFTLTTAPIDTAGLTRAMADNGAGAFVSFEGWVRDVHEGAAVTGLQYDVFEDLALSEGTRIATDAVRDFGLIAARVVHRHGMLDVGECAVWIGVTSRHRAAAFDACRHIIETIKAQIPIWKKEFIANADAHWVNTAPVPATAVTPATYYDRQMRLPEIGAAGQQKLTDAKVLVVGLGGLGSAAAMALAAAGIGTLGLAEHDTLSANNLHRQTLYTANDIGRPKIDLAHHRLTAMNPLITVACHPGKVTAENAQALFAQYDLVLDCTDNFTAKYLLSDAAMLTATPLVQASIYRFEGQLLTIDPADDAGCLRCLFPTVPAPGAIGDCAQMGVLGTVPMIFGTLQANEAIKRILGLPTAQSFTTFDLRTLESHSVTRARNPHCPACNKTQRAAAPLEVAKLDATCTIVDVREAIECMAQPCPGALHNPMSTFDPAIVPKDRPVIIVCAHGVRSLAATEYLRGLGYGNVSSLAGGLASHRQVA